LAAFFDTVLADEENMLEDVLCCFLWHEVMTMPVMTTKKNLIVRVFIANLLSPFQRLFNCYRPSRLPCS
jgi:hypothetical protein